MNDKDAKPWDLLNPNVPRVTKEVQESRMDVCRSCEYFRPVRQQCAKCLCIMPLKTQIAHSQCPQAKWGKVTVED